MHRIKIEPSRAVPLLARGCGSHALDGGNREADRSICREGEVACPEPAATAPMLAPQCSENALVFSPDSHCNHLRFFSRSRLCTSRHFFEQN